MKTLYPVDKETYAKIGKAYLICAEYPEVFGKVTFKKFCSMFVDVIDDDEDVFEAKLKANAPKMYRLLIKTYTRLNQLLPGIDDPLKKEIDEYLCWLVDDGCNRADKEDKR